VSDQTDRAPDPAPSSGPAPARDPRPGARARRGYHHGDLARALVLAGLEILEESGLPGLTLRAIAARAGVSHAAPRNHFGDFRGLIGAIVAEGFRRHAAAMRAEMAAADPADPDAQRWPPRAATPPSRRRTRTCSS